MFVGEELKHFSCQRILLDIHNLHHVHEDGRGAGMAGMWRKRSAV